MLWQYDDVVDELEKRIRALLPGNPAIRTMTNVWDLFKVPGFDCKDLQPSLSQAQCALRNAQKGKS